MSEEKDPIEAIEERRAARKAALAEQERAQKAIDLEALDALEVAHGDSNVVCMHVPYTPDLPTFAVAKVPSKAAVQRYRDTIKSKADGKIPDLAKANEAVAHVTLVYPEPEIFEKMCEARPGLKSQLGFAALGLSTASETAAGKG